MTFRTELLADIDEIRRIPDEDLDLRKYTVTLRVTTWTPPTTNPTGIRIGRGRSVNADTAITLASGANPKVRRLSYKETVAGGGKYQQGDFRVGPFTPPYTYGGVAFSTMAPVGTGDARTGYHFVLKGPDLPETGMLCEPIAEEADRNFSRYLVVRPSGSAAG